MLVEIHCYAEDANMAVCSLPQLKAAVAGKPVAAVEMVVVHSMLD